MASFDSYRVHGDEQVPAMSKTPSSSSEPLGSSYSEMLSNSLEIKIISSDEEQIVFDMIGVDAAVANALRRIMLAEVPTMAVEYVWMKDNTTVIQDEVLAHRIGLIPIKADAKLFEDRPEKSDQATDLNTIVLQMEVTKKDTKSDEPETVYSNALQWAPVGDQESRFGANGLGVVHDDIIMAKLHGRDRISLEAHCYKGIGRDHQKFSPCATASYRLLPDVQFGSPVTRALATELKEMCPMDVFDIEDVGGVATATAARPRNCTMCRECIRKDGWSDGSRVKLFRKADHFIFSVETAGAMKPEDIVKESIAVLKKKALNFVGIINSHVDQDS
jgi:DNA-directed RNA polymerase I and III subunit RPAC1